MVRKFFLLLIITLFFFPLSAHAQTNITINELNVDIWPEYDQPAVLMIYRITLATGTSLPSDISLKIPSDAQINAVAVSDSTGKLINAPYTNTIQAGWTVLKLTANSLQVQVEFYEPLEKKGSARHILFNWAGDYPVEKMDVNFLKPFGADNFAISLAPNDTGPGQNGLTNYHIRVNNLPAGQPFTITIDYSRQTNDLSISSLPVQAVSTPGQDTPGHTSMTSVLPWALGGIGAILIIAGVAVFIVWQPGGKKLNRHHKGTLHAPKSSDDSIYCQKCGKRAQPGDQFCRSCGTRIKRISE